ncbi:MAG: hypothetical protein JWM10_2960, partial [Myxococcaceae bacterium]|nr:hypothetical protein [Myxococcaceae bacterium]
WRRPERLLYAPAPAAPVGPAAAAVADCLA